MRRLPVIGALLLLASLAGLAVAPRLFFAAWLAAWWWCLGLVLGALVNAWMHRLSGGRWGRVLAPATWRLAARLPWLLPLFLPLAFGLGTLYPWVADPSGGWASHLARPGFVTAWLDPAFFGVRAVVYAALWCWLARPASAATRGRAAASLLLHGGFSSLAAIDLLMSLTPGWSSTGFALMVLSAQALGGSAAAILLTVASLPASTLTPALSRTREREQDEPPVWRDFGNLLLMWVMTWAYLAFMQFLVIWAENLPREIVWYLPRLHTGWRGVGVALVLLQLTLPLLALLFRAVKDQPRRLAAVAALLLATTALHSAWLVLPSVAPHALQAWWLLPLCFAGMGLLVFGGLLARPRERALAPAQEVFHAGP